MVNILDVLLLAVVVHYYNVSQSVIWMSLYYLPVLLGCQFSICQYCQYVTTVLSGCHYSIFPVMLGCWVHQDVSSLFASVVMMSV